jgi:hypothetical protein
MNPKNVRAELARARKSLQAAKVLHADGLFEDAVSRAYPPSQKATGVNPWMDARWVPSVALAKEGTLRRVPPYEACGQVPWP